MRIKEIWKRLRGIIIFGIFYLTAFFFIEAREVPVHIIHTKFDDRIPFCKYFIIPYVLWYFYVCGTILYLGLHDEKRNEYNRFSLSMILGMVVFIITSLIYPNGQDLRPVLSGNGFFEWAVKLLYTIDTPTNILPSLHVFASLACDIALNRDPWFKDHPFAKWCSHGLALLICLSTMFLKQHSIVDVSAAFLCNALFYSLIYHLEPVRFRAFSKRKALERPES